jgi:predicted nucleic acid-binding protein
VIFVDTNVFMYAVGRPHPHRDDARAFIESSLAREVSLVTSAEVLQEMLHTYIPAKRFEVLKAAWTLAWSVATLWGVEPEDVELAYSLRARHPDISARDLLHLACCRRHNVEDLMTFDKDLRAAWQS